MARKTQQQTLSTSPNPRVGVGVFVMKDGKFITLLRHGSHGANTWGLIGGHLEFGETIEQCAAREAQEEAGVEITNIDFVGVTNDIYTTENRHYVTVFVRADWVSGTAHVCEPHRATALEWFTYDTLPDNLFLALDNLKKQQPKLKLQ